jgi:hypothetical protein
MSDIGILNDALGIGFVLVVLGSPGILPGGIAGALVWRGHRISGAVLGAVAGFGLWLAGWLYFTDNLCPGSGMESARSPPSDPIGRLKV